MRLSVFMHLVLAMMLSISFSSIAAANVAVLASKSADTAETPTQAAPIDSYGRGTPRGAVQGFLAALAAEDNTLAARYLDDEYLSKKGVVDADAIAKLQKSLDAGGRLLPMLQINDTAQGNTTDLLPSDQDRVGTIDVNGEQIDVILRQKTADDGVIYWQFSKDTLAKLPEAVTQAPSLIERLYLKSLKDKYLLGYHLADVAALAILSAVWVLICYVLIGLAFILLKFIYPLIIRRPFTVTPKVIMPLSLVVVAALLPEIMLSAGVPVTLRTPVARLKDMVAWIAAAWLVLRLIDTIFRRAERISLAKNRPEQISLLGLLRKLAKAFMLILALIIVFGNLGFDLTTGIAALGVGGLALAFGAQKTIENLIGSVVVVADRPVRVGDYCKFGTYEGTVIDIGIRSTRVRTLNRTVVTIPNGEFSSLQIENYATRDMFHFLHQLYLKRSSTPAALAALISRLKAFLDNHQETNDEWTQVRISELRQDCYVLEIRTYIITTSVTEFYDKQTALLIEILALVDEMGVAQALPSQALTIEHTQADDVEVDNAPLDKDA